MIERRKFITRKMLQKEPGTLFVFGDNYMREGFGGQAREMRGMTNAVGIPTKRKPSMTEDSFLDAGDDTFEIWKLVTEPAMIQLNNHLMNGGVVVLPEDGIGTGLAELEFRAPKIWKLLQQSLLSMEKL